MSAANLWCMARSTVDARRRVLLSLAASLLVLAGPGLGTAGSSPSGAAPAGGGIFEPTPASQPLYGTQQPTVNPSIQRVSIEAADGVDLYIETWLPAAKDGNVPPEKIPTILIMTPYVKEGVMRYNAAGPGGRVAPFIQYFTARGYAVAQHHVRGTGESGGCLEQTAVNQIDDGARVVEYLGRDAPWSNGSVGMYGRSYDAETQLSVAGLGDPRRTKYLKAMIPHASVAGQYEYSFMDGVPYLGQAALSNAGYLALTSAIPGARPTPQQYAEKMTCQPEMMSSSANPTGDMTAFWRAREYRAGAPNVKAATLYVHGLADRNVQPIGIAGFFDYIPETTPHVGLFGQWGHDTPNNTSVEPQWAREDWFPMVTAWFDRYLKGLDTGVEEWPAVQVQDTQGTWRVEPEFPTTGGPVGHLALGPGGTLGAADPTGSTSYTEGVRDANPIQGDRAVFVTGPLAEPLHLTGQPALDLWLKTNLPDGHVSAKLQVIKSDGQILRQMGSGNQEVGTYGARSLQHLDPMPHNQFEQIEGKPAPIDAPIRVQVRFQPTDFVVPAGATLRLTIAGTISYSRTTVPSGLRPTITLLHDCEHPSALRFLMPTPATGLLDVREWGEEGLTPPSGSQALEDGGGIASAAVCGDAPERLDLFGPPAA